MGNRGDLYASDGTLGRRRWRAKRWITCTLDPGGGPGVSFDVPGRYYPLFFYDEAVALAAGHRPCTSCRRGAFERFVGAWQHAHGATTLPYLDETLHENRLLHGRQRHFQDYLGSLPDGVFVQKKYLDQPLLINSNKLLPWPHIGYGVPMALSPNEIVTVLTPKSIVHSLTVGYRPEIQVTESIVKL